MMRRWLNVRTRRPLAIMMVLCIMVMPPMRHMLFGLMLPTTWADTDTVHLYRVVKDFQKFDMDSGTTIPAPDGKPPFQVNISDYEIYVKKQENANYEYWQHLAFLESLPKDDPDVAGKIALVSEFKPLMTANEKAQLLFSFDTFSRACQEAGLTFFIMEASLMGVLRHHALIPWDDDIDIVMSAEQWPQIKRVLGNIENFELYTPPDSQWKFYMKISTSFKNKPFKFPNLDIFFYAEDETHIWALTKGMKHDLVYKKSDIFPLQYRPFEGKMVPVPCNLDLVVHKAHDKNKCVTPEYVHKTNKNNEFTGVTTVDCMLLYQFYPFVFVEKSSKPGYVDEYLKIGMKIIHKMTLPVGCKS